MINKMFIKDLKKFILTSIDPDIKDVCYTGIAHAIIDKMEITDTVIANRTLFISLVDEIGEEIVLDKEFLLNKLVNMAKYKLAYFKEENKPAPRNYFEFINLDSFMSEDLYNNINKYFNIFYGAYNTTKLSFSNSEG